VLVVGNIDTHFGGVVRLLVGSVSLVAGRLGEVSEGVGNSVEETCDFCQARRNRPSDLQLHGFMPEINQASLDF
jgi:hypothetical protein